MKSLNNKKFWKIFFDYENRTLDDELFNQLIDDFKYRCEKCVNEENGEYVDESITINIAINNLYSFELEIQLYEKSFATEYLFLIHQGKKYTLGWIDCHAHPYVFSVEEFYNLMSTLQDNLNYNYYFLLLSKYVTLTNEEEGKRLLNSCVEVYSEIVNDRQKINLEITEIKPYGLFKFKKIKDHNTPLNFIINEGINWVNHNGYYKLEGTATHSLRIKTYDNDDVFKNFPYDLWKEIMKTVTIG